jgi:hypothetical protein
VADLGDRGARDLDATDPGRRRCLLAHRASLRRGRAAIHTAHLPSANGVHPRRS